jgi:MYXO-CTERM domain-containing protein
MRHSWFLLGLLVGCGGGGGSLDYPDSAGTQGDMQVWAKNASAASVYAQSLIPLVTSSLGSQNSMCPSIVDDGTTQTYTGGCTDDNGNDWVGSAIVTAGSNPMSPGHIEYDGFGFSSAVDGCAGKRSQSVWNGTLDESGDASHIDFTSNVTVDADGFDSTTCAEIVDSVGISYHGTIEITGPSDSQVQTYAGSGEIGAQSRGKVSASTDSEVVDSSVCSTEAASGTTTISASGHTAVITYDGATKCDQSSTVTWTYDGADQGELTGVSCSTGGGGAGWLVVLGAAGFVVVRRRRR